MAGQKPNSRGPKRTEESDWIPIPRGKGVMDFRFASWRKFFNFMHSEFHEYATGYIFRGHANDKWKLEPSLDRLLRESGKFKASWARASHLDHFKKAIRSRRGSNPPQLKDDNDWWALGQHHGLATPLLDWTESPFVALYFAFADHNDGGSKYRVVYALYSREIEKKSEGIQAGYQERRPAGLAPALEVFRPMSDENPRLVSQRGLFTRGPDGILIETWVRTHFREPTGGGILVRFLIPNREGEREQCLRYLNRMNINHLSLFPDLYGASKYCNLEISIDHY
jgi:hypothetical protein